MKMAPATVVRRNHSLTTNQTNCNALYQWLKNREGIRLVFAQSEIRLTVKFQEPIS